MTSGPDVTATAQFRACWRTLTAKQRQATVLRCDGLGNKPAAAQMGVSEHTVKNHMTAVFHKMVQAGVVALDTADMPHICRHYGYALALRDLQRQLHGARRRRTSEAER